MAKLSIGRIITDAIVNRTTRAAGTFENRPVDIFVNSSGNAGGGQSPENMTLAALYRYQPYLRMAVDFYARHIAQLAVHSFARDGENREREYDSAAYRLLAIKPNHYMTGYELIYDLTANIALYNRAYWFVLPGDDGELQIHPFPTSWVTPSYSGYAAVSHYEIKVPTEEHIVTVDADKCIPFEGWTPEPGTSSSLVETIKLILEENHHSRKYRVQFWRKSGRVGTYLTRPANAPAWDNTARKRFYAMFQEFTGNNGARAGSTPMLEDGMELKTNYFKSSEEQWAESIKLSLQTVAQVYQIPPAMLGDTTATSYASMREYNKSLYSNTLGPLVRFIEDRLNAFVLPMLNVDENVFVEFNVQEKLRGSFEEQASILSTSTGAPWLTRNEARKIQNLPPVEGGDELITPLNVTAGGQASPQDGGVANQGGGDPTKTHEIIQKHLERIERIIPSKGMNRPRFERELTADLRGCVNDPPGLAAKVHNIIETMDKPPYAAGVFAHLKEGEAHGDSA